MTARKYLVRTAQALLAAYAIIGVAKGCAVYHKVDPIREEFKQVAENSGTAHCQEAMSPCSLSFGGQLEEIVKQRDAKTHSYGCWTIGGWIEKRYGYTGEQEARTKAPVFCYNPIPSLELFSREPPKSF